MTAHQPAEDTASKPAAPSVPAPRNPAVRPATTAPSPALRPAPATASRWKRTARRARLASARTRATAWKLVKMSGVEFIKGFARKSGALTALIVCVVVIAYALGVDPAEAVRHVLGM
ncbi:hypothetical protein AB0G81_25310 [Streptomyces asoensis]|uniref:hypothetical protein n=1 Tax=Streptomyces asoensis TaxID=249586 RepID=UPI0033E542A7